MKAKVIDEKCIGCGLCAELAPDIFELADNGLARVKEQPTDENEGVAVEAAKSCPTEAIEVE